MIRSFFSYCKRFLSIPAFYHYSRQYLLLGMPLRKWAEIGNYFNSEERIADLGCGPSDILRILRKDQLPEFYLGIDISDVYLDKAKKRAAKIGLNAEFVCMDLNALSKSPSIREDLIKTIDKYKITTVNMFGVLHHLDDQAAISSLNTLYECSTIQSLNTQDVLIIADHLINNFYVSLDRGSYVRTEKEYDDLLHQSHWKEVEKCWSVAGLSKVKYIHYRLTKGISPFGGG
ncbi:MAG: class I SAM-dependent methyltransferase [Saprospiraceae bacterium]|nr:class I SAM-dependent methyltransferase [Saprospiraceae bacterium]